MVPPQTTKTRRLALCLAGLLEVACSASEPGAAARGPASSAVASEAPVIASMSASAPVASAIANAASPPETSPFVDAGRARRFLFTAGVPVEAGCGSEPVSVADHYAPFIRCLLTHRFAEDPKARGHALELFALSGDVAVTEEPFVMEGGFRGSIKLVGELPVGKYEKHLAWVLSAKRAMTEFNLAISRHASKNGGRVSYRDSAILWKFARSVGRTTPSAYAGGWEIGWNVSGSLHSTERAVRDTIVHEIFHLNDQEHKVWSRRVLGEIVDSISARCGTKVACLRPYAPGKTMVRGGTYYAFQPDNGDIAHEYSAELATRYFNEQLAMVRSEKLPEPPFKCAAEENARALALLAEEFFGGVDLTPPCTGGGVP